MYYINTKTLKYPLSINDIKQENPNTSFPDSQIIQFEDYRLVEIISPPNYNSQTEYIKEITPKFENEKWIQQWEVYKLDEKTIALNTAYLEKSIRMERDSLLARSDWTQLPDATVNSLDWKTYRQQLRDITKQSGFPFNIVWPIPPN